MPQFNLAPFKRPSRGLPRSIAVALLCCLLATTACSTTQQLTRADRPETLQLSDAWYRLSDREDGDTLFRARHQDVSLELELEVLSKPLHLAAAPVWTRAWLASRYGSVGETTSAELQISGRPARRYAITVPSRDLSFEYAAVNASGATYLLTVWGPPSAFRAWEGNVDTLAQGITLPARDGVDSLACREEDRTTGVEGLSVTLPADRTDNDRICDVWNTTGSDAQVEWSLDSRLITGMLRTEALPYAIEAARYRDVFLDRTDPDRTRSTQLDPPHMGSAIRIERETAPVDMTDTYVFITKGERGWLLQLSTPTALMDDNQPVIDDIVQSLSLEAAD